MTFAPGRIPRILSISLLVAALALAPAPAGAFGWHRNGPRPNADVLDDFDALRAHVWELPSNMLHYWVRLHLWWQLTAARGLYAWRRPCVSNDVLGKYLHTTGFLRYGRKASAAEDLRNRGFVLRHNLLTTLPHDRTCPGFGDVGAPPAVEIGESDNTVFAGQVLFGAPLLSSIRAGGELWTQAEVPGADAQTGETGHPAVPTWSALVAFPHGTQPTVMAVPRLREAIQVKLYPFQSQAADQQQDLPAIDPVFADQAFFIDPKAYATDALFPSLPCDVRPVGQARDLQIAQLECVAAQYNPVSEMLMVYDAVDFRILYSDGQGNANPRAAFLTSASLNPFESAPSVYMDAVLNREILKKYVDLDLTARICLGEELLILTHPDFRSAADDLAAWKVTKGISTAVFEVGPGTPRPTANDIDDFIEGRYDRCVVRPSYVLLLGDAEFVPPSGINFNTVGTYCSSCGDVTTGSDWGYAVYPQGIFDLVPDFAVGRMTVDTDEEAQRVVDKVIDYESAPPFIDVFDGAPFYTSAAFASQFQCCRMNADGTPRNGQPGTTQRAFAETAEVARNSLLADGYDVDRIYIETVDNGGYCLSNPCPPGQNQAPYNGDTTPRRYYNGSFLPAGLGAGSGFPWNGSGADIRNAINAGRFLVLHRDHGSSSGFSNPSFGTGNISSLSNGELQSIVYSVNCASGFFDRETDSGSSNESFMEQMLLAEDKGMVGGLGDNRNSPTWPNNALTRGFFDATWPLVDPLYGGPGSHRRLGDILNHGKMYLMSQIGVAQTAGSVSVFAFFAEAVMWHAFGDPTLEMWTSNPHSFQLPRSFFAQLGQEGIHVQYPVNGAVITALQQNRDGLIPVGRGMVEKGVVDIPFVEPPHDQSPILFSASLPDAVSVPLEPLVSGPVSIGGATPAP
jgi:hypothetical protein